MNKEIDYMVLAQKIIAESKELFSVIKSIHGIDGAVKIIPDVVKIVENIGKTEGLAGADKKKLAVTIINILVDVPFIPEAVEEVIIGFAIDTVISALNKMLGKDWLSKVS